MLFPKEEEYIEWFQKAGFKDVQLKRIGPKWYRGVRRHGLIVGCSVTGIKPASGDSPLQLGPKTGRIEASKLLYISLVLYTGYHGSNALCTGPYLYVVEGSNCAGRSTDLNDNMSCCHPSKFHVFL